MKIDPAVIDEAARILEARMASKGLVMVGPAAEQMRAVALAGQGLNVMIGEHALLVTLALRDAIALLPHVDRTIDAVRSLALDFELKLKRLEAYNERQCSIVHIAEAPTT